MNICSGQHVSSQTDGTVKGRDRKGQNRVRLDCHQKRQKAGSFETDAHLDQQKRKDSQKVRGRLSE